MGALREEVRTLFMDPVIICRWEGRRGGGGGGFLGDHTVFKRTEGGSALIDRH